ncbi:hypothetical protein C0V70_09895 [Bacteriovorax stolpii]|uniref:Uncharacterized protein n=1 Tax=Bacteriovorax stolpii TaxID=960 RepID=A0A2K9NSB7_BACTC|nr:DUF4423 domain-containing protein [Bacteriovorax stolpii]AUN98410.1 hypothetical protein C0V70_09895 [Bacteriovorax stolpii]TDP50967.1 uncharacterized protein (TIGR02147 family) [Bacteriovorax stolpii]
MSEYNFTEFKDFFEYNLKKYNRDSEGVKIFTLNDLSKRLGYKSPSLLSMIATGRRLPSNEILEVLFEEWKIEKNQREIIRIRLEIEKRMRKNKPAGLLLERLAKIDKKSKYQMIDLDAFNSIKEWHNLVLQMLVSTPDFKEDYTQISYLLKRKVTPSQVRKGIETLLKVGLIKRNPKTGELESATPDSSNETTHDIPSEAIREHHKGMIARALEAVEEQSVHERHLNALTLKFNKDKTDEAKAFILNFVKDFNSKFYDHASNDIHQLNVQFFGHTNSNHVSSKETLQ